MNHRDGANRGLEGEGPRVASIDALRAVAVFAVICIHTHPFEHLWRPAWLVINQLCGFAVPFFFMVSSYLYTRKYRAAAAGISGLYWGRMKRLAGIFAAWTVVYFLLPRPDLVESGGWRLGFAQSLDRQWDELSSHWLQFLFRGSHVVLWFLVALMIALTLLTIFLKLGKPRAMLLVALPAYLLALYTGSYAGTPVGLADGAATGWGGELLEVASGPLLALLFVALGALLALGDWRPSLKLALALLAAGLVWQLLEALLLAQALHPLILRRELLGTVPLAAGVMLLALALPQLGRERDLARWGRLALGVYAAHPLVLALLTIVLSQLHVIAGIRGALWQTLSPLVVFELTAMLTVVLARTRYLQRLVV